jgi:hypothetical protein
VSEAKILGIPKTGYEALALTTPSKLSFHCLKAKKKNKMRIHPISGHRLNLINSSRTVI